MICSFVYRGGLKQNLYFLTNNGGCQSSDHYYLSLFPFRSGLGCRRTTIRGGGRSSRGSKAVLVIGLRSAIRTMPLGGSVASCAHCTSRRPRTRPAIAIAGCL